VNAETRADRLARALIVQLLGRMRGGTIDLTDAHGGGRFGDGSGAEGVELLSASVHVNDPRVYTRVLRAGSVGLGDAYARGWWDTDDLAAFLRLLHRRLARTHAARDRVHRWARPFADPIARRRRPDSVRDVRNVRAHYDLGNEFFEQLLDETMSYSCAVFDDDGASLARASLAKMDRLIALLELGPGGDLLEIGTGWGGFALHAAAQTGCSLTTTTISRRQYEYARARVRGAGLDDRVTVRDDHYRDLRGTYDGIVAIEMIEAVDWREYDAFFAHCRRLLRPDGALALQAITVPDSAFDRTKRRTDFIKAEIFPGGCLPSLGALTAAAARHGFTLTHADDIGLHYGETLRRWRANLGRSRDALRALGFDEQFVRRWEFYLAYCEAGFDERYLHDFHLLYTAPAWRPRALRSTSAPSASLATR
jgi:cyclopropane-fatty-acyl-phospholipid synthase